MALSLCPLSYQCVSTGGIRYMGKSISHKHYKHNIHAVTKTKVQTILGVHTVGYRPKLDCH